MFLINVLSHPQRAVLQASHHQQTQSGAWRASGQHRESGSGTRNSDPCHRGETNDGRRDVHVWPVWCRDLSTSKIGFRPVVIDIVWPYTHLSGILIVVSFSFRSSLPPSCPSSCVPAKSALLTNLEADSTCRPEAPNLSSSRSCVFRNM